MTLLHRGTCECGWTGTWTKHFVASSEIDVHHERDDCDGEAAIQNASDLDVYQGVGE